MKIKYLLIACLGLMPLLEARKGIEPQLKPEVVQELKEKQDNKTVTDKEIMNMASEKSIAWNDQAMDAISQLTVFNSDQSIYTNMFNEIMDTFNNNNFTNLTKEQLQEMVEVFLVRLSEAQTPQDFEALKSYTGGTKGMFLARVYDLFTTKPEYITTEIALRGTTNYGSAYFKEYFFVDPKTGKKIDKEKETGEVSYFYSERTKPGFLSNFGIGYVDKRSWGKYFFDKFKYPAIAAAVGYGAYKGSQTERGQNALKYVTESDRYKQFNDNQWVQSARKNTSYYTDTVGKKLSNAGQYIKELPYRAKALVNLVSNPDKRENEYQKLMYEKELKKARQELDYANYDYDTLSDKKESEKYNKESEEYNRLRKEDDNRNNYNYDTLYDQKARKDYEQQRPYYDYNALYDQTDYKRNVDRKNRRIERENLQKSLILKEKQLRDMEENDNNNDE